MYQGVSSLRKLGCDGCCNRDNIAANEHGWMLVFDARLVFKDLRLGNNNNNNNNTQLLSCHVSTDTVKTIGVESQARVVAGYWL